MSQTNTSKRQLIIIDSQVNDWQSLANTVSTDSLLLILNSSSDGLTQMSDYLADLSASAGSEGFAPLQSIHIISHGSSGSLLLGSSTLTANNLSIYSSQLASIGHSLTETGDILLYGCDVAQGEMGTQFIQSLAHYTGADVAASDDLTGDAVQGGDWLLENTTGQIEAAIIAQDYSHTLSYTVIDNFNFNYNDAMTSAIFSQAAYCLPSEVPDFLTLVGWEAITPGTTTGWEFENAYAIAGKRVSADDMVQFAIAFEGSNPPLDQLSDWTTTNASEYGWSQYYANLMPLMTLVVREAMLAKDENKNVELLITGHSLGGAAASVAYADLFLPSNQDFWIETKDDVPLKNGHRIYDQTGLDQWTDAQIRALLTDTNVYTFGAPSFLIEPTKPSGSEWLALGFDLVTSSNPADFFFTLGAAVAEAVIVDDTLIRDLSGYWEHVFQFEHENSDWAAFVDPVASIGSEDAGTVLDINLTTSIYDRYNEIASFPEMHSMDNYVESIARLISGAELIKSDNPLSSNSPLLNQTSIGTAGNDFLLNAAAGYGYAGNDVFVANSTGNYNFNGGSGHDTYVIGDAQAIDYYNINFTLSGPVNEIADYLYLDLLGRNIATSVEGDDLVLQIGSTRGVAAVRVQNWYSSTLNYQLDRIAQIHPGTNTQWSLTYYDYKELGIPLFLTGTTQIDIIYGSMTDDSDMRGLGGNDKIYGRDGNDTIYGDYGWDVPYLEEGGWDVIYGGNGNDTLYAEGGSGELYGEAGHDTLWGGSGSDSLFGGEGTDSLYGSQGRDFLEGGEGNDILFGDEPGLAEALSGNDELYGGAGDDVLYGHYGNDELSGEEGGDTLYGGNGYDTLYGGIGNDKLNGDGGNDILFGGGGLNRLRGGADDDYLISISPIDDLDGGGGNDTYRLESKGNYTIQETGYGSDRLILYFFSTSLPTFNVSGADLIIAFADGNQQIIEDMSTVGSQVETLEIYASFMLNGTAYEKHNTYNLFMAWNAALQGDASGGSALISSTNFVPTGFNLAADGDDVLIGSDAADELRGYGGNDTIDGRGGNDRLFGDEGNDTFNISGNSGVDTVNGGSGPDTLNLDWSSNTSANWLAFSIQKADASWQHFGYYHGDNGSYSGDAVSPSIDGVRPQFYDNLKKQMDIIPIF